MQGGLEVPCLLTFTGHAKYIEKAKKLVEPALQSTPEVVDDSSDPPPLRSNSQEYLGCNLLCYKHKNVLGAVVNYR